MKKIFVSIAAILFAAMLCGSHSASAQGAVSNRTQEEKEYFRLFETPLEQLSIDDQLLRFRILHLAMKNYYVDNGELKTHCTKRDFARIGAKPSLYKVFMEQLQGTNDFVKQSNPTVQERNEYFEKFVKDAKSSEKTLAAKIAKIEKQKDKK